MPRLPPFEKTALYITFRCHYQPLNKEWIEFLSTYFKQYVVAYETHSTRPHFHALIYCQGTRRNAFTKLMQTRFPECEGNENFAVHNLDPDDEMGLQNQKQYICKGDSAEIMPNILHNTLIPDTAYCHNQYWVGNIPQYFESIVPDTPEAVDKFIKTPKQKEKTFMQKFIIYAKNELDDIVLDYNNDNHIRLVTRMLLKKLGEKGMTLDQIILKRMTLGVLNALEADNLVSSMEELNLQNIRGR